jgi:hypothetical protein
MILEDEHDPDDPQAVKGWIAVVEQFEFEDLADRSAFGTNERCRDRHVAPSRIRREGDEASDCRGVSSLEIS